MRAAKQCSGSLTASALALGLIAAAQSASAGIANTLHNLSSGNLAIGATTGTRTGGSGMGNVFTTGTNEICVFCHTPHGANTSVPVPLWNKGVPTSTIYTTYSSGTMNGLAPTNLSGHMSIACLSCHDGTQAMDNMINSPGRGGYFAAGSSVGYTWTKNNDASDPASGGGAAGIVGDGTGGTTLGALAPGANIGSGGMGMGGPDPGVYDFGTDLSQNHPIGMPYCGGNQTAPGSNAGCLDQTFNGAQSGLGGWFEVGSDVAGAKTNLRIYGNDLSTATVECGSCHDPHSDTNERLLRKPRSNLCATCHVL